MHIPSFPSSPSLQAFVVSDVHILLFLLAAFIVLALTHAFAKVTSARLFGLYATKSVASTSHQGATSASEKSSAATTRVWAWANGFSMKFESLPITLETHSFARGPPVVGAGVGVINNSEHGAPSVDAPTMSETRHGQSQPALIQPKLAKSWYIQQQAKQMRNHGSRSAPSFEHPVAAVYQSELPVSMAKMIMSRHTHRRPQGPTRRSASLPPSRRREALPSDVIVQDELASGSDIQPSEANPPSMCMV
ncbi:hypothetical protein HGRIS_012084 [Hohenbuehelia grisea]|uniref:ATP synthase protein MI25 n=1 Tax=Hohenbuehelia grisea TaxID=104357 RepID=A0ABR3IR73_9AGAR